MAYIISFLLGAPKVVSRQVLFMYSLIYCNPHAILKWRNKHRFFFAVLMLYVKKKKKKKSIYIFDFIFAFIESTQTTTTTTTTSKQKFERATNHAVRRYPLTLFSTQHLF